MTKLQAIDFSKENIYNNKNPNPNLMDKLEKIPGNLENKFDAASRIALGDEKAKDVFAIDEFESSVPMQTKDEILTTHYRDKFDKLFESGDIRPISRSKNN